ncbi:hypothetical protein Tco_1106562 [Tanacetum coccineum]
MAPELGGSVFRRFAKGHDGLLTYEGGLPGGGLPEGGLPEGGLPEGGLPGGVLPGGGLLGGRAPFLNVQMTSVLISSGLVLHHNDVCTKVQPAHTTKRCMMKMSLQPRPQGHMASDSMQTWPIFTLKRRSAEENNNEQARNASFQEDEFINPFCTRVQETGESSSFNSDNTDVHSLQPKSHDYRGPKIIH